MADPGFANVGARSSAAGASIEAPRGVGSGKGVYNHYNLSTAVKIIADIGVGELVQRQPTTRLPACQNDKLLIFRQLAASKINWTLAGCLADQQV